jgi:hypothetical protein
MKKVIVKVENIDFEIFRSNIEGVKWV